MCDVGGCPPVAGGSIVEHAARRPIAASGPTGSTGPTHGARRWRTAGRVVGLGGVLALVATLIDAGPATMSVATRARTPPRPTTLPAVRQRRAPCVGPVEPVGPEAAMGRRAACSTIDPPATGGHPPTSHICPRRERDGLRSEGYGLGETRNLRRILVCGGVSRIA